MVASQYGRLTGLIAVCALLATACGGGSDDSSSATIAAVDDSANEQEIDTGAGSEAGDDDSPSAARQVDGALVSVLDFGLGLYGIDRNSGESFELAYETDWFSDRGNQPTVVGDRAYTLMFRELDDVEFVNETSLAEFDLTTGRGREIVAFGPDSESAESLERTTWELIGAGGDAVWIRRDASDAEGNRTQTIERYSISSGEQTGELEPGNVELTTPDGGTCSAEPRPIGVGSDGTLYVNLGGIPARVDNDTFDVVEIVSVCFNDSLWLSALAGTTDLSEFTITDDDSAVPGEQLSFFYDDEPLISNDSAVVADDAIWWVFSRTPSFTDAGGNSRSAIIGGIARLDLATTETAAFPIGPDIGEFLDQEATGFSLSAMSQVDLQFVDEALWLMDRREAQPLRKFDPATGTVTQIEIPVGDGNDFVEAELIATDPDGVWLSVSRRVVTSPEGENRSTSGMSYVDQVDPTTGEFVRSLSEGELTGFGN